VNDIVRTDRGGGRRPTAVIGVVVLLALAGSVAVWTTREKTGGGGGHPVSGDVGSEDAPIDNGKLALSDSEAKYLQDAEHLGGFVLGDLTLPQVGAAISDGDEERLESFLSKDFAGEVFPSESGTVALLDVADVRTWRTPRDKTRKVDAREFVSQVMAWRSEFKKLASASL